METHQERVERKSKASKVMVYFLLGMLALSSIGYAFLSSPYTDGTQQVPQQEGVVNMGSYWLANFGNQQFAFSTSPEEAANVSNSVVLSANNYIGQEVYIDAENAGIYQEIALKVQPLAGRVQQACYGNCTRDLPEKNCQDYLIVWKDSADDRVYQQGNCVFIEGGIKAIDSFGYRILGIN